MAEACSGTLIPKINNVMATANMPSLIASILVVPLVACGISCFEESLESIRSGATSYFRFFMCFVQNFYLLDGAYFIPVIRPRTANATTIPAKIECATKDVVTLESRPTPTTGTEFPR